MREIKILQQLEHSNIVKMIEITMAPPPDKDIFIVFDYLEHDLSGLIKSADGANMIKEDKSGLIIKGLMYQLLLGLEYLHEVAGIVHRDMKGSNILIDKYGRVKLADFGLARSIFGSIYDGSIVRSSKILPIMTNRVITLWYRPPEVLLGADNYGPEVDVWGLGCIFAELFLGKAAFSGSDEISQVEAIAIALSEEQANPEEPFKVLSNLPWYKLVPQCLTSGYKPQINTTSLRNRLKETNISQKAMDLLFSMLEFDTKKRITCREALRSSYFDECSRSEFQSAFRNCFENSNFFKFEFKSSEPKKS